MMRVSRRCRAATPPLAQAFAVELDPDPIAYYTVVPLSPRLAARIERTPATGLSAIPLATNFVFCGGKALGACPIAAHHSRAPSAGVRPAGGSRQAAQAVGASISDVRPG